MILFIIGMFVGALFVLAAIATTILAEEALADREEQREALAANSKHEAEVAKQLDQLVIDYTVH